MIVKGTVQANVSLIVPNIRCNVSKICVNLDFVYGNQGPIRIAVLEGTGINGYGWAPTYLN